MSSIDERIVRLQFDNKAFKKNAEDSLKALEQFDSEAKKITKSKGLLDLGKASKSMSEFGESASKINLSGLSKSVELISSGFSKLGTIGHRVLENLADDTYRYGKQMVKSLTVDQITAGYSKYEDKTSAVQTIMAATAKDFKDQGEQMAYVNGQLEKLQWFTDETSYNFNDMVSSIGKFTGAGVKLDDAVAAMQGVATWAAKSGVNATKASGAYYNLSQAIGLGYVQLMDWHSIQGLNMDTMEFKELVLDTAVAMGTLKKNSKGALTTLKKHEVTAENFANNLSDQWFTADVLMQVLEKYGMASEKLYTVTDDLGITATEMLGYIEDYQNGSLDLAEVSKDTGKTIEELTKIFEEFNSEEMRFSLSALRAAQEAKTFTEAVDATKDAVSSQWSKTYELVFGDYQQAKKLWSMTAEYLWDIFAASGEARNELLEGWKELGGQDSVYKIFENTFQSVLSIIGLVKDAWQTVFPPMTSERLYDITERVREFTENLKNFLDYSDETSTTISENGDEILKTDTRTQKWSKTMKDVSRILQGVFSGLKIGLTLIKGITKTAWNFIKQIFPKNSGLLASLADLGDSITELSNKIQKSDFFEKWQANLAPVAAALSRTFTAIKNSVVELWANIREKFKTSEVFKKAKQSIQDFFKSFYNEKLPGWIDSVTTWITTKVPAAINKIVEFTESAINFFQTNEKVQKAWASISKFFTDFKTKANEFFKVVGDSFKAAYNVDTSGYDNIGDKIMARLGPLRAIYDWIKKNIFGIESEGEVKEDAEQSKGFFATIIDSISKGWADLNAALEKAGVSAKEGFSGFVEKVKVAYAWLKEKLEGLNLIPTLKKVFDIYLAFKTANIFSNFSKAAKSFGKASETFAGGFKSWLTGKTKPEKTPIGEQLKNIGIGIGLIAVSLYVISTISDSDLAKAKKTLWEIGGFLLVMMLLPNMIGKKGDVKFGDVGKQMFQMALGITILALGLKLLSAMSWDTVLDGIGKLSLVLLDLALFSRISGGNGAGKGFFALAMSLLVFVGVIKLLAMMEWGTIGKGITALGLIFLELGAFIKASGGNNMGKFSQYLGLAVLLGAMCIALKVVGSMDFKSILKGVFGLGAIIIALMAFTKFGGKTPKLSSMMILLVGVGLSMLMFYELVKGLENVPVSQILGIAGGFLAIMGAMALFAASLKIMSGVGIGGAVSGSLGLMAGIAIITLVVIGLSELYSLLSESQQDQILEAVNSFGDLLGAVGSAIGKILSGFLEGATSGLPTIGTTLSTFMTNADGFFAGLKKIDEETLAGAGRLALLYGEFTLSSLADWVLSGAGLWNGPIDTFAENLPKIGTAIADFATNVSAITPESMQSATDAAAAIKALNDSIPNTNFIENILGVSDMGNFATNLPELGLGLLKFATNTAGLDANAVKNATDVGKMMTELAKTVPDTNFFENVLGVSDMGNFATNLPKLGEGMKSFANNTKELDPLAVGNATIIGSMLTELSKTVPDTNFFENIVGVSDMGNFASKLGPLGEGLASFCKSVEDIAGDDVLNAGLATSVAGLLSAFAITVPNTSFLENLFGISDLSNFSNSLGSLGTGLGNFYENASKVTDTDRLLDLVGVLPDITTFATSISGISDSVSGLGKLLNDNDLANKLQKLGNGYNTLITSFLGTNTGPLLPGQSFTANLTSVLTDSKLGEGAKSWGEAIQEIAKSVNYIDDNIKTNKLKDISAVLGDFGQGVNDFISTFTGYKTLSEKDISAINSISSVIDAVSGAFSLEDLSLEESWQANWTTFLNNLVTSLSETDAFNGMADTLFGKIAEGMQLSDSTIVNDAVSFVDDMAVSMSARVDGFYSAGSNLALGFARGIDNNIDLAYSSGFGLGKAAITGLRAGIAAHSPSREAIVCGNYFGEGFQIGIKDYAKIIQNDSYNMGTEAVTGLIRGIAEAKSLLDSGVVDMNPVISPVLDLTNVEAGAQALNDMLYFGRNAIPASLGRSVNSFRGSINNPDLYFEKGSMSNADVVQAINSTQSEVAGLKQAMLNMGIYLENGALVGGLKDQMDQQLGSQFRRDARRG